MKTIVALLLALSMMLSIGMCESAQDTMNDVDAVHKLVPQNDEMNMTRDGNCKHPNLVRITENAQRYVKVSGSLHTKEEYFTARCSECLKYKKEIIDSQVVEPHTMVLIVSDCIKEDQLHRYVYECKNKCNYRDEVTLNCPGIHEQEGVLNVDTEEVDE